MPQERDIVSAAESILSLRRNAVYYPPFAFYVHLSLKTKKTKNLRPYSPCLPCRGFQKPEPELL